MSGDSRADNTTKSDKNPDETAPDEESLPRRFGRLTLLRLLARGGMGEVFLATSGGIEGAERPCVVKIIRREHAEDRSFLARFLDEARIQSQLHHPAVAQILEASVDDSGKPFVVVEPIEGRNLGEIRTRAQQLGARIAWPEALAVGIQMAEGLAHVHERTDASGKPLEIVHRDLSPQNVMLGYSGELKLIDFGTARGENRRCHTVAGIVFAKPGYVAPEVANNNPGGVPADLYAFGVMLWELVAARRFLVGEAAEHMALVGSGKRNPAPVAESCAAPPELDAIIQKLTATRIEDRYASAREALVDLVELMKRAPSLPNGERSLRARVQQLMQRLYPAEPARSRAEFVRLIAESKKAAKPRPILPPPSPSPPATQAGDATLLPGTRYRLTREIGRGAMGVVHEAFHVDLGRRVAIKVLGTESSSVASSEQLKSEARAIARLEHENLVRLHDFGITSDGRAFYAMELLSGETLERSSLRGVELEWREAVRIVIQACNAASAAHAAGVIHRDIKPANLFVCEDGVVKLLDFGVAKLERDIEPSTDDEEALVIVGTPEYMAPEQARAGIADARSDVYALGGVLFELVTGRLPFEAESIVALLDLKSTQVPPAPRECAPQRGIPTMLDKTIRRALEPNPDERFQSAEEMREALEHAIREPEIRRQRRRKVGFAFVGVVMVAILGVGVVAVKKPAARERVMAFAKPLIERVRGQKAEPAAAVVAVETPAPSEEPATDEGETAEGETVAADDEAAETGEQPATAEAATEADEKTDEALAQEDDKATGSDEKANEKADEGSEESADEKADEKADEGTDEKVADAKETDSKDGKEKDEMFSGDAVKTAAAGDTLEADIAKAGELMQSGAKIKGFNMYRKIGRKHMKDARALKAWSEAAASMKGYGEALRVARRWVTADKSDEARLHLAKMERMCGKRTDAMKTLNALLKDRPGQEEARAMLRSMNPEPRVARR